MNEMVSTTQSSSGQSVYSQLRSRLLLPSIPALDGIRALCLEAHPGWLPLCSFQCPLAKSLLRNRRLSRKALHADSRIVNVNRCCAWTQPARIIVHAPRAVSVRIARVLVLQVPQQCTVLPDPHFSRSAAVAPIKSLHVKPASHGDTHEGLSTLLVAGLQMVVAQVKVHLPRP